MRSRHGPRRRLRTAAEFDAVFKRGARLPGRLFLLVVAQSRVRFDRLGLAVSRKVGGAVARNRARRLVRESFRRLPQAPGAGIDVVVVAHKELVLCSQAEVDRELRERLRRVPRTPRAGRAPAAAGG
ncbi:MAG TPA: ribonuclease P protein component [Vicinamibacteria bacterium]|nr:ribonuclease P protein component [Vicinamibacteria bacterium]